MDSHSQTKAVYQGEDNRLLPKIVTLLKRVNPTDIFSTRDHSNDFKGSRADYISVRARILSIVFALLALIWIPLDYMVMDADTFKIFLILRCLFTISFLLLAFWGTRCDEINAARFRITGFIVVPSLFYMMSHILLPEISEDSVILIGYSFFPFLVMALLAIFPLTLLEGISFVTLSLGLFVVTAVIDDSLWTVDAMGDLWLLFLLGGIALWVEMTQLYMLMNLYREATRDALTGLVNRRILSKKMEEEVMKSERDGSNLHIMLFDLDLFKRINDNHGHKVGDHVLQQFGKILKSHASEPVVFGRYGGEEFLAVVSGYQEDDAISLAESIRLKCHDVVVKNQQDGENITFTTSIGMAKRKVNESAGTLFSRVDEELYRAKASGRDLLSVADE